MKKYYMITCICALLATSAAVAETCANGSGTVFIGMDKTKYCTSNIGINWWSSFAWCEAIGGKLIDLTTECNKVTGTVSCPNFAEFNSHGWTQNVSSDYHAYSVYPKGAITSYDRGVGLKAICVGYR